MNAEQSRYSPGNFLRLLRDQALLILVVTAVFGAAAFAYSVHQKKIYTATGASLDVVDPGLAFGFATSSQTQSALATAEGAQVTRLRVAQLVKQATGAPLTIAQLQSAISTRVDANSNVLDIEAKASSPALAADIANSFAQQDAAQTTSETRARYAVALTALRDQSRRSSPVQRTELAPDIARTSEIATAGKPVLVVGQASPPSSPTQPKTLRNTLLIGLLGLLLGIVIADVRRARDRRLHRPDEIRDQLDLPLVGHVSSNALGHGGAQKNGGGVLTAADLEAFRIMRQNLDFLDAERSLRSVAVTSALAQEGKSTVAALLAHANAAAGKRTLLLECDLRRPTLAARLGLKEAPGLCDYLGGSAAPQEILQTVATNPLAELDEHNGGPTAAPRHPAARLVCITAGSSPRPAELLASDRFRAFMAEVREAYDFVVLDTSPLVPVVDTRELLPLVDGVIVCVRAAQTTREAAAAAKEALGRTPSRPTGIVVTGITPRTDLYYHYYSSYSERT